MPRTALLAAALILGIATDALAQPRGRWGPAPAARGARFPRLANVALSSGFGSRLGGGPERPLAPAGRLLARGGLWTAAYLGSTPVRIATWFVGPAIRGAHVALNGAPSPGRPLATAVWVASPLAARVLAGVGDPAGDPAGAAVYWEPVDPGGVVWYGPPAYQPEPVVYAYYP